MTRSGWIAAVVGSLAVVFFLGWMQDGGLGLRDDEIPQESYQPLRDIQVVWIVERAVFSGLDPSLPIGELAVELGVSIERTSILEFHPRLPSGYLLEAWVALLPPNQTAAYGLFAVGIGLALVVGLTGIIRGDSVPLFVFPLLVLTDAVDSAVFWRSTSWMVAVSILGCWALARRGDGLWAGLTLVPAIGSRIFPLILVPILWIQGRKRAAAAAIVGSVALNLGALALPNVSVASTIRVLTSGKTDFLTSYGNGSIWALVTRPGGPLALAVVLFFAVILGVWWWSRRMAFDRAFGLTIVAGLVAAPVAWSHFRLALLPLAVSPLGLGVWLAEFAGWLAFEWRWVTGLLGTLFAGYVWYRLTARSGPLASAIGDASGSVPKEISFDSGVDRT